MPRFGRAFALCAVAAAAGCGTPRLALMSGDADSASVSYAGDLAASTEIARKHCAAYDRVPRYIGRDGDAVNFECDRR